MATQIVMDHAGDSRFQFDPQDAAELAQAEHRFKKLTAEGFVAAKRITAGNTVKMTSFDPTAHETLFFPRLIGG